MKNSVKLAPPFMDKTTVHGYDVLVVHDATKMRIATERLAQIPETHIVYPGGVTGDSATALLQAAKKVGKYVTLFFHINEETPENALQIATYEDMGAKVHFFNGTDTDGFRLAYRHAMQSCGTVFSFADNDASQIIADSLEDQLKNTPPISDVFLAAARGGFYQGVSQALYKAEKDSRVHVVQIVDLGHKFYEATVHKPPARRNFGDIPQFPCNHDYEAAAWHVMCQSLGNGGNTKPKGSVLFYNGSAPTELLFLPA